MNIIEELTREREKLNLVYTAQASLLDSLICRLSAPPVPAAPLPVELEPVAKATPTRRKSPEGSGRGALRQIVADMPEPFSAPAVAVASGKEKKFVSSALSTWLANGELESAGTIDGIRTYKRTAAFPTTPKASIRVEHAYKEFRAEQ
jgi:hypothetical protein